MGQGTGHYMNISAVTVIKVSGGKKFIAIMYLEIFFHQYQNNKVLLQN